MNISTQTFVRAITITLIVAMWYIVLCYLVRNNGVPVKIGVYCNGDEVTLNNIQLSRERIEYIATLFKPDYSVHQYDELVKFICNNTDNSSAESKTRVEDLLLQKYIKKNSLYLGDISRLLESIRNSGQNTVPKFLFWPLAFAMIIMIGMFYFHLCKVLVKRLPSNTAPQTLGIFKKIDGVSLFLVFFTLLSLLISMVFPDLMFFDSKVSGLLLTTIGTIGMALITRMLEKWIFP